MDSINPHFDSWDDFLYHYRQGHFPSDRPIPRPQLDTAYPPTPPYAATDTPLRYLAAPLPMEEERRLRALYSFQILQSGIDPNFERIVQLVAMVMGVKGCMITLVDHKELTVKAQHPPTGFEYFPREGSLCGHTILRAVDDPFVVLDTKADWRFQNLEAVNADPFVRFYAGSPLTTSEGFNVGSLCLIDDEPRSAFTEREKTMLIDFAAVVMREMELWNDQVQLCIRNRMMRDVTRWVRGCLDFGAPESPVGDSPATEDTRPRGAHPLDPVQLPLPTPSDLSASSGTLNMTDGPALISPPIDPVFPTPSGSPTLLSRSLGATPKSRYWGTYDRRHPPRRHYLVKTDCSAIRKVRTPSKTIGLAPLLVFLPSTDDEPWAYFIILSASHTKQFSFHERIYLKNFGSCMVTEVMKRRVEAADRAKGTFIKSISHELRTPLHIILGILELLYANPEEPLSETQQAMVYSAEASGKSLIDTINNIIDLANLDPDNNTDTQTIHGNRAATPSPESDEPLMEEIDIRDLKLRSDRKPVLELMVAMDEPERDPDHDTLWSFTLDIKTITRILTQLVENAIKFTATGFVELSAVALTNSPIPMKPPHPDARAILFTVRDTGKGISADFVQSHLFKRFSQEDPLQVGTGLGMALVKELVKKLGGWMEVWSEGVEGKGCVVKVLFWASPASHPTKSLKDMDGPWQNMSCRFYAGEPALGSDRLFKIMGERMMGQQLSMRIERGNEQDTSAEDMLKTFADESHVQKLVDEYLETQAESDGVIRPASIVILNKPVGPLKLAQSLRDCFTPAFSSPGLQTPQGSPQLSPRSGLSRIPPMPMIRSATVPHITTTTLGVNDSRLLAAAAAPTIDTSCSDRPLPRVLIVEDNITNRMILRTFLKKRGIGVVEAENGLLGVERFQEEVWRRDGKAGFEFVLMDLQMPVMDGNIATKKIREFEQRNTLHARQAGAELEGTYRRTMIFALTGLAADEDKRLAFECGVDGYLTKPVSLKVCFHLFAFVFCIPATRNAFRTA
ncbi:MAG: hypothetical protein J3R72DRAFT_364949 [Linnemannia gamsii]|nr:MAG: hypothetical protein J3R72DRAFT_364949 [Linnemannia gamsii]